MKHYCIAGLRVAMETFGRTEAQARVYEIPVDGKPDIVIQTTPDLLQQHAPYLSLEDCEYISSGERFYRQLLKYNGMMLHASCVVVDDRAYLFSAPSGTGKSTHTNLWLKQFGDHAYILNDDKPALRLEDCTWYAYGTPWSGKHDINRNVRIPIAGIAVLERGSINRITPLKGAAAITAMLNQTVRPADPGYRICILETLDKLISQVPIWKLQCNTDPAAALVSYRAMSGLNKENGYET